MVATLTTIPTRPEIRTKADAVKEWLRCAESCAYFIDTYVEIYDPVTQAWIPFRLWPFQARVLKQLNAHPKTVILKARQLGLSWLVLAQKLWKMIFHPVVNVLLFSRREDEALHLMERLKEMYSRLPSWMRPAETETANKSTLGLSNGSIARAFPTNAGDSYAATDVLADEFDLVEDQNHLMRSVKPTIDAGGSMTLLSRVDKTRPVTEFKRIYVAARDGLDDWKAIFLPWYVRPDRDQVWYESQKKDSITRTGGVDDLYEQYPATDAEALAERSLDKRLPAEWIQRCYDEQAPLLRHHGPALNGLAIYREPEDATPYVIGADPAEGLPTSDDSALTIINGVNGEEVATLAGKFEPSLFASYISQLSRYYNNAPALPERNNHGHAVIVWLTSFAPWLPILPGLDGRPGWMTSGLSKSLLYTEAADYFKNGYTLLHDKETNRQLTSIESATLSAPKNQHDDRAVSYVLALKALGIPVPETTVEELDIDRVQIGGWDR